MAQLKCKGCGKVISGVPKIRTYQKRVGKRLTTVSDYYDADCFNKLSNERALNDYRKQKRIR